MTTETPNPNPEAPSTPASSNGEHALAPSTAGQVPAARPSFEYDADDPVALYMNPGVFEMVQRVARLMASAAAVPEHLRNKISDCFLVAAQAFRWRMDPFAVAQHTFVLKGKLGYEGKLVAAVLNSDKRVTHRLDYAYSGEGLDRKVIVTARLRGEDKDRSIEGTVRGWKTADNDKWSSIPDQMLAYRGAREWARRHAPEVLLGVSTEDELPTVTLAPRGDGTFAAPPETPDPLLAGATDPPAPPVEAARSDETPPHPADAADAEKEPPVIVHPPVTPPPTPEPTGTGAFSKALENENRRRGGQRSLVE